jgi:hypothetical protein
LQFKLWLQRLRYWPFLDWTGLFVYAPVGEGEADGCSYRVGGMAARTDAANALERCQGNGRKTAPPVCEQSGSSAATMFAVGGTLEIAGWIPHTLKNRYGNGLRDKGRHQNHHIVSA